MISKIDTMSSGRPASTTSTNGVARTLASGSEAPLPAPMPARNGSTSGRGLLERAGEAARSAPDADLARVNDIRTAIARGEFNIDAKAVARAFIRMESA